MTSKSVRRLLLPNRRVLFGYICHVMPCFPRCHTDIVPRKGPTLVPLSISALRIMAFVPLMSYTTSIFISYFQAYNNTKLPFILNSLAQWLFYAPMLYLLLMVLSVSPSTAFWVSSANTFLVLVLHWYYYRAHRKLIENHFFD